MHIPDGFLDAKTIIGTGMISAGAIGTAVRQVGRRMHPKKIPLIGLTAAFIFVAQMINFPVASGTSGHIVGATLAAVLLGPSAAIIVMACVLVVQAFLFADGGVFALGANLLNMAVVAPLVGYAIYRLLRSILHGRRGQLVASAVGAWIATVTAAVFCAGELAWSGTAPWGTVFPAMAVVHMAIGVGESLVTMLVLAAIVSGRPELLPEDDSTVEPAARAVSFSYAALFVIALMIFIVPQASSLPDGLERVAAALGFENRAAVVPVISAPLPDYRVPWSVSAGLSVTLAALIGAGTVFGGSFLLARILVPREGTTRANDAAPPAS